ncbi:MAG: glutaredoxin family protein [Panacagrimonas sp.]
MATERDAAKLRLLGRPDCELCEEMLAELHAHPQAAQMSVEWFDVDRHPEWQRRYGLRIPVLLDAWDEVVCEGRFSPDAFGQFLDGFTPERRG